MLTINASIIRDLQHIDTILDNIYIDQASDVSSINLFLLITYWVHSEFINLSDKFELLQQILKGSCITLQTLTF